MGHQAGGPKRAAAELARLCAADANRTGKDATVTSELDELVDLASVLRTLPADGPRPEFRAALRARLLDEACALGAAPESSHVEA